MKNNVLYLYSKTIDFKFKDNISTSVNSIKSLDYIKFLKENSYSALEVKIDSLVKNNIDMVFIAFNDLDASLDFDFLLNLKEKYNLKFVLIFLNSQNSFEFIDRYYSLLADKVIIDDIPFLEDFYKSLSISCEVIDFNKFRYISNGKKDLDFNISKIKTQNIFLSSLTNLTKSPYMRYYFYEKYINSNSILITNRTLLSYEKQYLNYKFRNIIKNLALINDTDKIYIDEKFKNVINTYKIYWIIFEYLKKRDLKLLLNPIIIKNFIKSYKIFNSLKRDDIKNKVVIDVISKVFYKEYKL